MSPEPYQYVSLRRDLPDGLQAGDVGTLLDYVPHLEGGEEGCVLEVFNALGESLMVVAVPASVIKPLRADEVLSVRVLQWH